MTAMSASAALSEKSRSTRRVSSAPRSFRYTTTSKPAFLKVSAIRAASFTGLVSRGTF